MQNLMRNTLKLVLQLIFITLQITLYIREMCCYYICVTSTGVYILMAIHTRSDKQSFISIWCHETSERLLSFSESYPLLSWDCCPTNCELFLCSISKFDERSAFLYVLHNAEDFQIYFCTEMHCKRSVLTLTVCLTTLQLTKCVLQLIEEYLC